MLILFKWVEVMLLDETLPAIAGNQLVCYYLFIQAIV